MSAQPMAIGVDLAGWLASLDCPTAFARMSACAAPLQGRNSSPFCWGEAYISYL